MKVEIDLFEGNKHHSTPIACGCCGYCIDYKAAIHIHWRGVSIWLCEECVKISDHTQGKMLCSR